MIAGEQGRFLPEGEAQVVRDVARGVKRLESEPFAGDDVAVGGDHVGYEVPVACAFSILGLGFLAGLDGLSDPFVVSADGPGDMASFVAVAEGKAAGS